MIQQSRRTGLTISAIKEIKTVLDKGKSVSVVGLKSPDLYLRMLKEQGCGVTAEETSNGFIFKLKNI